jgi:methylthioribose-1-phosphate isomerase
VGRGHLSQELAPEQIVRLEEDGPTVVLLDQRRLPDEVVDIRCATAAEVADAIEELMS